MEAKAPEKFAGGGPVPGLSPFSVMSDSPIGESSLGLPITAVPRVTMKTKLAPLISYEEERSFFVSRI
jgi:hypothetical protein